MTDVELIAGIKARDKQSIQFLVSRYHKQVIRTAFHFIRDMDDAEDTAQEVCIEILESIHEFRGASSLSTWIYRITVNKALNHIRKNKRKVFFSRIESLFSGSSESEKTNITEPSGHNTSLDDKERKRILDQAIGQLPENQRIAFVLSKFDELTYQQIAEVMNVSLPSVESYLQRAKQNLRKILMPYFSEYTSKNVKDELQPIQEKHS